MRRFILITVVVGIIVGAAAVATRQYAATHRLVTWKQHQDHEAIGTTLVQPIDLPTGKLSLAALADGVAGATGVDVSIDWNSLNLAGITSGASMTTVEVPIQSLPAASHLSLAVQQLELCWFIRRGQIVITTPEVAANQPLVDTSYSLRQSMSDNSYFDAGGWAGAIEASIEPSSWKSRGGQGHCESVPGAIVVAHRPEIHRQIRTLLTQLQDPDEAPGSWRPVLVGPTLLAEANAVITEKLRNPASIDCQDLPLGDFVNALAAEHNLPLVLNHKKLEEANVSRDTPIMKTLSNMSLQSLLHHVLRDLELTLVVRDGVVQITTPEDAESQLILVAYPVHDLVSVPPFNSHDRRWRDVDSLIELITSTMRPDSWGAYSGPGPIDSIGGWLLIPQTQPVHEEIEQLLRDLRHTLKLGETPPLFADPQKPATEERIRTVLDWPLAVSNVNLPLDELAHDLGNRLGIPVLLNQKKLQEASIPPNRPINGQFPSAPARVQLARLLDPHDFAISVRDGALVITTPEDTESRLFTRIYDVRSLLETDVSLFRTDATRELIDLIRSHTRPAPQRAVTGPGAIDLFHGLLVVAETPEIHRHVEYFLAELHRAAQWRDTPSIMPPTKLPPVDDGISSASTDNGAPESVYTRIYDVRSLVEANRIDASTDRTESTLVEPFIKAMTAQIEPDSWSELGGVGHIDCAYGVLIVSQTRENHTALESLLDDLRHHPVEAQPPSPVP